jgi:hypothetical protein
MYLRRTTTGGVQGRGELPDACSAPIRRCRNSDGNQAVRSRFIRVAVVVPSPRLPPPERQGRLASRLCRRLRVSLSLAIALLLSIFIAAVQLVCRVVLHLVYPTNVVRCVAVVSVPVFVLHLVFSPLTPASERRHASC